MGKAIIDASNMNGFIIRFDSILGPSTSGVKKDLAKSFCELIAKPLEQFANDQTQNA